MSIKDWGLFVPRFLLFPIIALVGQAIFVAKVGGEHWVTTVGWVLVLSYCWFCVAGSFHEAVHQTLFRSVRTNVWYGRFVGILIGIPYTAYKETHRRHHAYLNTPDDYELWPYSAPGSPLWFRRVFVWMDILFGVGTAPVIYGRVFWDRQSGLSVDVRRVIRREYVVLFSVWSVVISYLWIATVQGRIDWSQFRSIWLLPLVISPAFNTVRKFTEHLGLSSTDPILGTRTVLGTNPITRLCSYFNFDIYIHGPHHRYPRAPHQELKSRLKEIQRESPPDQQPRVFSTYFAAILDMLPCLWICPGVGKNVSITTVSENSL